MAKKLDYEKLRKPRAIYSDVNPINIPDAPVKSETKANKERLARIKAAQKAEEEARKKEIAAAKAKVEAEKKAYAAGIKSRQESRSGAAPDIRMRMRPGALSPYRKTKMLRFGGKVHRGRPAEGNKD